MIISSMTRKNALQLPVCNFVAQYNNPTIGKYALPGERKTITKLEKNSIYLLERFSFSCNLPEDVFISSLDREKTIHLQLYQTKTNHILKFPFTILSYHKNSETNLYIYSTSSDDLLECSLSGELFQMADSIGIAQLNFAFTFAIYQTDNNNFCEQFRNEINFK